MAANVRGNKATHNDRITDTIAQLELISKNITSGHGSGTGSLDNAFYGFRQNGSWKNYEWACHAQLRNASGSDCEAIYSCIVRPGKDWGCEEASEAYFSWITGPNSPWKAALDYLVCDDPKFMLTYGFGFTALDNLPTNLMINFLVASRMPKEWPNHIRFWHVLVSKYGIHPGLALVHAGLWNIYTKQTSLYWHTGKGEIAIVKGDRIRLAATNKYDWPLDVNSSESTYIENFCNGTMVNLTDPVSKKLPIYGPVNNLWGENKELSQNGLEKPDYITYPNFLLELYGKKGELGTKEEDCYKEWKKMPGKFKPSFRYKNYWEISYNELIEIIKKEQERLGLKDHADIQHSTEAA